MYPTRFAEIRGIGFPNKGAELMLLAILQHFQREDPLLGFGVRADSPYADRRTYPVFQLPPEASKWRFARGLLNTLPASLRMKYGAIRDGDVSIYFDASGFAFGDQWGAAKARRRLSGEIRAWKRRGSKVILMPQAFGPFTDARLRDEMRVILEEADLVCARDGTSAKHLHELGVGGNIRLFPDFTPLLRPTMPEDHRYDGRLCLVPNSKITEMRGESLGRKYETLCARLLDEAQAQKMRPFILIHEGHGDLLMARNIRALCSSPVDIVQGQGPLELKGIISRAEVLVTSRFHALVSALSQGVPALVVGWSHKYKEFLLDYDAAELELDLNADLGKLFESACDVAFDASSRCDLRSSLTTQAEIHKRRITEMWKEIDELVLPSAAK